jgi:hypothetical protein
MRDFAYGVALAALAAAPAAAQSGTAETTVSGVIVASRQHEERVQDVPAAVTRSFYGDPGEVRLTLAYAFGSEAQRRP